MPSMLTPVASPQRSVYDHVPACRLSVRIANDSASARALVAAHPASATSAIAARTLPTRPDTLRTGAADVHRGRGDLPAAGFVRFANDPGPRDRRATGGGQGGAPPPHGRALRGGHRRLPP